MRVGILTFHHAYNYGAMLQAYALVRVLESWGHQLQVIDYRPRSAVDYYRKVIARGRPWLPYLLKAVRMSGFARNALRLSGTRYTCSADMADLDGGFDALISGSDQIWCLGDTTFRQFDPAMYLNFSASRRCRRISYAASFGETYTLGERATEIGSLLRRYHGISVRDHHSRTLIKQLSGRDSEVVLDPTLLWPFPELQAGNSDRSAAPYAVLFAESVNEPAARASLAAARALGLPLISLGYHQKCADRNVVGLGPLEFLRYLSGASLVITTMFHGVALALAARCPFIVLPNERKRVKDLSLLGQLGMQDRVLTDCDPAAAATLARRHPDYDRVAAVLADERHRSLAFLRRELGATSN